MPKTILVIDDDAAIREAFTYALIDVPYKLEVAESGDAAIAKMQEQRFDLIFLDLRMPGMNGIEVLKKVHALNSAIPIYIITAFAKEFFAELTHARQKGINFELISKPASNEQIQQIVNNVLA
ncbi:MAG: response regulator [Gammaproteobacteria bacterium]|nr:response regulator [Gammaproteobacteria bacterium]